MISPLLLQIVTHRTCAFLNLLKRRNSAASPGTRLHAHLRRCVCPHMCPLLLHRVAPLRVIPFVQTRPRQFWLPHHQEPGHMCICVAMCTPLRTSHPAAARGPTKGYFTCANPSTAVPVTHPLPQAVRPGLHFYVFPPHRPDAHLRPFLLPALCSDRWGHPPRYMLVKITHGNALACARLSLGLLYLT